MTILLAIETSCDETGVGIVRLAPDGSVTLLADEVASSVEEHVRFGGVVPERELSADEARTQSDADEREAAPRRERVPIPRELVDMAATGQAVSMQRAFDELGIELASLDDALDRAYAWFVRYQFIPSKETRRTHV